MAPQPGGGLWPRHRPVGRSGCGLAQPSSLLPRLDRTTHNLKEAGWTGRQKGEAGVNNRCIQKASR